MARINDEIIEEIKSHVDIVDVIKHYIPVTQKGRNYWAVCPFHQDTNPSMSISVERQIYKCFVCGSGGNMFTFIQNHEHVHFVEALKIAADLGGLQINELENNVPVDRFYEAHKDLYTLNDTVAEYFSYFLKTESGLKASEYLANRAITLEMIEYFKIGYAPDFNKVQTYFTKLNQEEALKAVDLIHFKEDGRMIPRFFDRIVFPIENEMGRIVGFSGRTLDNHATTAKYINSAETSLFKKSQVLYNMSHAKTVSKKAGFVYLVEGFMDVLSFYKAGILNVVATMGTALTPQHIKQIKKYCKRVIVAFDGDKAGIQAALKSMYTLKDAGVSVQGLLFPERLDPDDYLQKHGINKFQQFVTHKLDISQFVMDALYLDLNMNNHEDVKKFVYESIKHIVTLKDPLDQDKYVKELAKKSQFKEETLTNLLMSQSKNKTVEAPIFEIPIQSVEANRYIRAEQHYLFYMLHYKRASALYEKELGFMFQQTHQRLANYIVDYYRTKDRLEIDLFINQLPTNEVKNLAIDIAFLKISNKYDEGVLKSLIKMIRLSATQMKLDALHTALSNEQDVDKLVSIGLEILSEMKKMNE